MRENELSISADAFAIIKIISVVTDDKLTTCSGKIIYVLKPITLFNWSFQFGDGNLFRLILGGIFASNAITVPVSILIFLLWVDERKLEYCFGDVFCHSLSCLQICCLQMCKLKRKRILALYQLFPVLSAFLLLLLLHCKQDLKQKQVMHGFVNRISSEHGSIQMDSFFIALTLASCPVIKMSTNRSSLWRVTVLWISSYVGTYFETLFRVKHGRICV